MTATSTADCPVCGTAKGDKKSCCAQGGTWQGKCGSPKKFDHTWQDGIAACRGKLMADRTHACVCMYVCMYVSVVDDAILLYHFISRR